MNYKTIPENTKRIKNNPIIIPITANNFPFNFPLPNEIFITAEIPKITDRNNKINGNISIPAKEQR